MELYLYSPLYASMTWTGTTLPYFSMLQNYAIQQKKKFQFFVRNSTAHYNKTVH